MTRFPSVSGARPMGGVRPLVGTVVWPLPSVATSSTVLSAYSETYSWPTRGAGDAAEAAGAARPATSPPAHAARIPASAVIRCCTEKRLIPPPPVVSGRSAHCRDPDTRNPPPAPARATPPHRPNPPGRQSPEWPTPSGGARTPAGQRTSVAEHLQVRTPAWRSPCRLAPGRHGCPHRSSATCRLDLVRRSTPFHPCPCRKRRCPSRHCCPG